MDAAIITHVASSVVTMLAPYLAKTGEGFAENVGKKAFEKIDSLYQAIKERFQGQHASQEALNELELGPNDEGAHAALRLQLKNQMTADPTFVDTLRQLVDRIGRDEEAMTFLTQVYGGEVNKIVSIGKARDVRID